MPARVAGKRRDQKMSNDDELRINTLHRFAKHSSRLTLQEYSHCEVPAGCGGVVLRWVDNAAGPQARIRIVVRGRGETWLDGVHLIADRAAFSAGRHVLAIHLQNLERSLLAISIAPDLGPTQRAANRYMDAPTRIERWMPGKHEGASAVDFDDHAWQLPREATVKTIDSLPQDARRPYEWCLQNGMTLLELGTASAPLAEGWLRITLAVDLRTP
jgi:hypothetical protein